MNFNQALMKYLILLVLNLVSTHANAASFAVAQDAYEACGLFGNAFKITQTSLDAEIHLKSALQFEKIFAAEDAPRKFLIPEALNKLSQSRLTVLQSIPFPSEPSAIVEELHVTSGLYDLQKKLNFARSLASNEARVLEEKKAWTEFSNQWAPQSVMYLDSAREDERVDIVKRLVVAVCPDQF
jgi:hypothetical protein